MTDQTHAQLRERIAQELKPKIQAIANSSYGAGGMADYECEEEAYDLSDFILALLSPPDTVVTAQRLWLWSLLDEIDTASDIFKDNYEGFAKYVYRKADERHKIARSDGHSLVFNDVIPLNQPGDGDLMRFNASPEAVPDTGLAKSDELNETMDRLERLAEAAKDDSKTDLFAAQSAGFIQLDRWHYYAAANPHAMLLLIKQFRTAIRQALTTGGSGWRPIETMDQKSAPYGGLIKAPSLIDPDFNPEGISIGCRVHDAADAPIATVRWNGSQDFYADREITDATHWKPFSVNVDPRKSTGMHDEEGREIFEGDWVEFNVSFFDGNFKDEPISGKIVYVPELMSFQLVNVQSDYWREYTGGDDSTYQPFSELNFTEADFRIIEPPLPTEPETGGG